MLVVVAYQTQTESLVTVKPYQYIASRGGKWQGGCKATSKVAIAAVNQEV